MARIRLFIEDSTKRLALQTALEAEGHTVVETDPELAFCDQSESALGLAPAMPVILLTTFARIHEAVAAMYRGVHGYIMVPLVPGEAAIAVVRALAGRGTASVVVPQSLEDVELHHIQEVVRQCRGNQAEAARRLGIGRNTLWRKLKKHEHGVREPHPGVP